MKVALLISLLLLPASATDIIAHRGASGYLPEHTLEAYAAAYFMGSDYIEQDLVMTKDKELICLHDIFLEPTTDVEEIFSGRRREDGHWYAIDFTLEEVKKLRVHERTVNGKPAFQGRFPYGISKFEVPTFEEAIELVQGLNKSAHRDVGIYPELKRPEWHRKNGLPMEEKALEILRKHGYTNKDSRVYVQCFEDEALQRIRKMSDLKLVRLIGLEDGILNEMKIPSIAGYADAIGVQKELLDVRPEIADLAHRHGLKVHVWTFRYESDEEMKGFVNRYGVDGIFTDFPDRAYYALRT
jgi:glycerophosphoryl diester phosphodiesterase